MRRSEIEASSASAIAVASSAKASGCPWKFPLETSSSSSTKTRGLSVAAFSSTDDRPLRVGEQVAAGAVHLRRAPERVRVLHLVAPAMRLEDRRSPRAGEGRWRPRPAGPASGRSSWISGRKLAREPWSASSESAHAMSAVFASRSARTSASAPTAAMNCVPLMRDRPSFASSETGSSPTRASASAPESSSPSSSARPSPTSGSARCASGARSPEAPTEPRLGTIGVTPRLRQASRSSTVSARAPEYPFASVFARRSIAALTISSRVRIAHAARVAPQEPQLQLGRELGRDRLRDEAAEPRVDPVRVLAAGAAAIARRARGRRRVSACRRRRARRGAPSTATAQTSAASGRLRSAKPRS